MGVPLHKELNLIKYGTHLGTVSVKLYPTDKLTGNESASYLGETSNFQRPIILFS